MTRKIFACTVILALAACLLLPAAALYPDDFKFVPTTDIFIWEVESNGGAYVEPGDSEAAINLTKTSEGYLVMQKTAKAENGWPRMRTCWLGMDDVVAVNLAKTSYFYYDFTATGTANWAIGLSFENMALHISLAKAIMANHGDNSLVEGDDGKPGTYKGRIDLNKVVEEANSPAFKPNDILDFLHIQVFIVCSNNTDTLTIREMRIGSADDGDSGTTGGPETSTPATAAPPTKTPGSGNTKTADPGVAMLVVTGLAGLAGTGMLIRKRK